MQESGQFIGRIGPEDAMEEQIGRIERMDHRVRGRGQPAEQVGIPEPELVLVQAVVVDAEVQGEQGQVVGHSGVAVLGLEPAARLLDGLSELRLQGGHGVHRLAEEEEFPEDGQGDAGEEEIGSRAFHGPIIRKVSPFLRRRNDDR